VDFEEADALAHAPLEAQWTKLPGRVEHVFTHFTLHLSVFAAKIPTRRKAPEGTRFVAGADLDGEALPSIMRKVVEHARSARTTKRSA
jgi:A/G-specific adenine glycosylase